MSEPHRPGGPDGPDAWEQACAHWGLARRGGGGAAEDTADATDDVVDGLPEAYAMALRLQAEGLDDAAIGRVLAIEEESVGPLLTLARAKLAKLEGRLAGADDERDGGR